jgi:hypothetical protein
MVTLVTVEVMITVAAEALLRSVVDWALTVTVLPAGTPKGAVNVVASPLAVWAGEKVPQSWALPHVATQVTPEFATSLLTVADTEAVPPTDRVEGGACMRETETVGVDDSLAFVPVIAQPAVAIETARRSKSGRCVSQRRFLKVSFFPGCTGKQLAAEPVRP